MSGSTDMTDATNQTEKLNVQVVERLTAEDKAVLDAAKTKRELALANANLAVAKGESADLAHNNIVLRLAIKYSLRDGDLINEDGTITRKTPQQ
jgi:hypothetical protein